MSAELSIYVGAVYTKDGKSYQYGSLSVPVQVVTLDGDANLPMSGTLAASEEVTLWSWSSGKPDFTAIIIQSSDVLDLGWKCDKPTSDTDSTALGTYVNYQTIQIEGHGPHIFTADQARVSVSATAKSSTSLSSSTQGKVYEIKLRNNGSDDVDYEAHIFN